MSNRNENLFLMAGERIATDKGNVTMNLRAKWQRLIERFLISETVGVMSDLTVSVGTGGDYSTLNEALEEVSRLYRPLFIKNGATVTINLKSGFEMAEQVFVRDGVDLSWITITSDAAEVPIQFSALTRTFTDNLGASWKPAFAAKNAALPTIGCLFSMTSGSGGLGNGMLLVDGSKAYVLPDCGIEDAEGRGVMLQGSTLIANGASFRNAKRHNLYAENGSVVMGQGMNLDRDVSNTNNFGNVFIYLACRADLLGSSIQNATLTGAEIRDASVVSVRSCNMSNAGGDGLWAYRAASVDAKEAVISDAGSRAIFAQHGATIDATEATVTDSTLGGVVSQTGSKIIFDGGTITGTGASAVEATSGGEIHARNAVVDVGTSITGFYADTGGKITASGASATDCDIGVRTAAGGQIVATSGTFTGCTTAGAQASGGRIEINSAQCRQSVGVDGASDIRIFNGAIITASSAVGGVNTAANTLTSAGIIFK